jgi:glycosyltransferase involved in cell wall biosynthesis
MNLSVCLATKNGEKYIKQQLRSIVTELADFTAQNADFCEVHAEIVLVDDASTDKTVVVAKNCLENATPNAQFDFKFLQNKAPCGVSATFERAITAATGDYILISDQDDIWTPGRLKLLINALVDDKSAQLVASNYTAFSEDNTGQIQEIATFDQKFRLKRTQNGHFTNLKMKLFLKTVPFYGCTMAFRAQLKAAILPFPHKIDNAYDEWIAYCALAAKSVCVLEENTVLRRVHENNLTARKLRKFSQILQSRLLSLSLMSIAANRRHKL